MTRVIGVKFKEKGTIYYFTPGNLKPKKGNNVIVETGRGLQFGQVESDFLDLDESKLKTPLKEIIRLATPEDEKINKKNIEDAAKALKKCRNIVEKQKLNMYIIDASFTFDREQLLFHFLSDNRVDFRNLAKELASSYKTRIELRQIGVRDKAKEVGGLGPCGRELCCSKFLTEFDAVSINMAKNQNIALNPNKINGICGRLLCCLKYEDDCYAECRKGLPKIGAKVSTDKGTGIVKSVDILSRKYTVDVEKVGLVEVKLSE